MGTKQSKEEVKPAHTKLDFFNTYTKATDSSSASLNETPREKVHVVRRASRRASKVDMNEQPDVLPSHHFSKAQGINVQKATKRHQQIFFHEGRDTHRRKVTLAAIEASRSGIFPQNSLRYRRHTEGKKLFTPQTQILLRKQTEELPIAHRVEFELDPENPEIYNDYHHVRTPTTSLVTSRYKLIKPRLVQVGHGGGKGRDVEASSKQEPNVVSLLKEAATSKYEIRHPQSGHKTVKKALNLRTRLISMSYSQMGSPLNSPISHFEQEVALRQYKIKAQVSVLSTKEAEDKQRLTKSRAENVWMWKGKKGANLQGKSG